jgi:hypothetical protein
VPPLPPLALPPVPLLPPAPPLAAASGVGAGPVAGTRKLARA